MKAIFLLLAPLTLVFIKGWSQQTDSVNIHRVKKALESGVFARNMNLQYIRSIDKYDRSPYPNADSLTAYFFRFFHFEWIDSSRCYVGKVFVGERYLERDFKTKYNTSQSFEVDKEGLYMICKLYDYNEKIFVNIYPDFVTNIYNKKLYMYDKKLFKKINIIFSFKYPKAEEYYKVLKKLALQKDISNEDLFANARQWKDSYKKRQFQKFIKCFKVNFSEKGTVTSITKKYTKYAFSDERIEDPIYTLDYKNYKDIPNNQGAFLAFIEPWKRSDIGLSDSTRSTEIINLVEQENVQNIRIKSFDRDNDTTNTYQLIDKSSPKKTFWIYAGVLQKDTSSMADTVKCIVCISNDKLISLKNGGSGFSVTPRTDAYLRTNQPYFLNGTWKKAPITAIAKGLDSRKNTVDILIVKDKVYIPSVDGQLLLWLKVEKQQ